MIAAKYCPGCLLRLYNVLWHKHYRFYIQAFISFKTKCPSEKFAGAFCSVSKDYFNEPAICFAISKCPSIVGKVFRAKSCMV